MQISLRPCLNMLEKSEDLTIRELIQNPWNNTYVTYELGPALYWHSGPGGAMGGGEGYSANFYTAEAHSLTFYIPFFTILYTFYWQMVLPSQYLA